MREEEGDRLPSALEAMLGHSCPSLWRTSTFPLAFRLVVGQRCCARGKRGRKYPKRVTEVTHGSAKEQRVVMESWSSEGNGVVTTIPSTACFPPGSSVHTAEVSSLETTVQRQLPGSFYRDVA